MWEQFFNWQSDMDWAWGPLRSLRPPPDMPIRPWVWVRLFLIFTAVGLVFLTLCAVLCVLLLRFASVEHWSLPLAVTETVSTLKAMATDPATRLLLFGLALSLPPIFFTFCIPYHWAWNRRASRLQLEEIPETYLMQADVWPPAPEPTPPQAASPPETGVGRG